MMTARLPLVLFCVLAPAAGGFLLARRTGNPAAAPALSSAAAYSQIPEEVAKPAVLAPEPVAGSVPALARDLLKLLAANDTARAHQFVQGSLRRQELLQSLFEQSPQAALRFLGSFPEHETARELAAEMFTGLPPKDLPLVIAWMDALKNPFLRSGLLQTVLPLWLREDEAAATAALHKYNTPEDQAALRHALNNYYLYGSRPVSEKLEYLRSLPPDEAAQAWADWSGNAVSVAPEQAAAAIGLLPDSPGGKVALRELMLGWGGSDPLRAQQAALDLPDAAQQATAFQSIAKGWSGRDSHRASQWVDSLPAGPLRDASAAGLVEELTAHQPDAAFTWAKNIGAPEQRMQALRDVFKFWNAADPAAATASLETSDLTPEERQKLRPAPAAPPVEPTNSDPLSE